MRKDIYSFEQMCIDTNVTYWLDIWDYDKNKESPDQVSAHSNLKYWFKCPRRLHESTSVFLCNIAKYIHKASDYKLCKECNSIGQYIVDTEGEDTLYKIWSDKNTTDPFCVPKGSTIKKIWIKCTSNSAHPDYDLSPANYLGAYHCPYCSGRRVCNENSLGNRYQEVIDLWSTKNVKTPFDYTYGSGEYVWWKCDNHIHADYKRAITNAVMFDFKCPTCGRENQKICRGPDHPRWKGGITPKAVQDRKSQSYNDWREKVYFRDQYLCQVCLDKSHTRLTAHHLYSFANFPDLRFDVANGITCCVQCHHTYYHGSFHQQYGTHDNTPDQFNEYVNNRRKQLGINIPFDIYSFMSSAEDDDLEIDDSQLDLYE